MDYQSILRWNVMGASNAISGFNIRSLVQKHNPAFLCIQESKCHLWSTRSIKAIGLGDNVDWRESSCQGLSGGILTVWKKDSFKLHASKVSKHWIWVQGLCQNSQKSLACLNVYAPQGNPEKVEL